MPLRTIFFIALPSLLFAAFQTYELIGAHKELRVCEQKLEEKTNEFNGCLTSYNFVEFKLQVCEGR